MRKVSYILATFLILLPASGSDSVVAVSSGTIAGTVSHVGKPVSDAIVTAYRVTQSGLATQSSSKTDASGKYSFSAFPPGEYKLLFKPKAGSSLLKEWWDGHLIDARAMSGETEMSDSADPVTVVSGGTVRADASLVKESVVRGRITGDGLGLPNVVVLVGSYELLSPGKYLYSLAPYAWTDSDGNFEVRGLAAATYKIELFADSAPGNWTWMAAWPPRRLTSLSPRLKSGISR